MSQQVNYPPPPPSPAPSPNNAGFPNPLRRRAGPASPPSLSTNFLRAQGVGANAQSPASAVSLPTAFPYSPSTPSALSPRPAFNSRPATQAATPATPNMAGPYNPRQWTQLGHGSSSHMPFQRGPAPPPDTREVTGMEAAMPSPPPPYSPEIPAVGSSAIRSTQFTEMGAIIASPLSTESSGIAGAATSSLDSPSFPPPPGAPSRHRERSASGIAGRLANFAGRSRQVANDIQVSSPTIQSPVPIPPAARRAASTGHLPAQVMAASPAPPAGGTSPERSWHPGMPLPPPPPGPPPPGQRSQSLNRYPQSSTSRSITPESENSTSVSIRRRAQAPSLGTVPPTPANWMDDDVVVNPQTREGAAQQSPAEGFEAGKSYQPLRIETGATNQVSISRRPAKRDTSAQGIRERRSRSRAAKDFTDSISQPSSDESRPGDLVLDTTGGSISRRREHMRTVSGYQSPSPKAVPQPKEEPTTSTQGPANILTPPYTPAVRNQSAGPTQRRGLQAPSSATSDRPISHLLHTPNEDNAMPPPLSPARPMSRPASSNSLRSSKLDAFALQAMERHRKFIEKEVAAKSDEQRLELFTNFIVHESRLRRDRYFAAYNAMAADVGDLTRDMWRSYSRTTKRAATRSTSMSSYDPTVPSWASDGQPASAQGNVPSSATSLDGLTPATDNASFGDPSEALERSESRQWDKAFKPSLSPIPSMAQSSAQDDGDSRGRTQSRWWESDSGSIGKPDRIEKSRRETKYMGVNPAMFQDGTEPSPASTRNTPTPSASFPSFQSAGHGPDEYPPEKSGWHEGGDFETPIATPARVQERSRKGSTPGVEPLDVSRLVTLPPPYPRHHPAVNNGHPLLADLRNEYRRLADMDSIEQIKERYQQEAQRTEQRQHESTQERRTQQRTVIQENVLSGKISFADAARAEAEFEVDEAERGKANAKTGFETFETVLAHPLNTLLTDRIRQANDCIKKLRADLDSHNEVSSPDQTQEEGDERPERLEKLTLLKWLFEAREHLSKEMFGLHAKRSEKYSEVVLAPYRLTNDEAKIREISAFFAKDSLERQTTFAKDSLKRFEELLRLMDRNVSRGVEDQLSAFWDIAPGLLQVIQQVPADMAEFDLFVPPQEYDENPIYHDHPLQYLYTVLLHAEKSAYQYIESQTNLLCLLHEVRTGITKSNLRLIELERSASSTNGAELKGKMKQARRDEEDRLTADLQEKVGEVERQWKEALGNGLEQCKGQVKSWLELTGGWEDGLEE